MKKFGEAAFIGILAMLAFGAAAFGEVQVVKPVGFDPPATIVVAPHGAIKDGGFSAPAAPAPKRLPPVRVGVFGQIENSAAATSSKKVQTCVFNPESTEGCMPNVILRGNDIL